MKEIDQRVWNAINPATVSFYESIDIMLLWILNARHEITYMNRTCAEFLGAYRRRNTGVTIMDVFPESLAAPIHADDVAVLKGSEIHNKTELIVDCFGEVFQATTTKIPLRNLENTQIVGQLGHTRVINREDRSEGTEERLGNALRLIRDKLAEPLSVSELASACYLSPSQFHKRFKAEFGVSPLRYVLKLRIMKACKLLAGDTISIGEVAERCGFDSQSYFTKQFRELTGMTPRAYRKKYSHE